MVNVDNVLPVEAAQQLINPLIRKTNLVLVKQASDIIFATLTGTSIVTSCINCSTLMDLGKGLDYYTSNLECRACKVKMVWKPTDYSLFSFAEETVAEYKDLRDNAKNATIQHFKELSPTHTEIPKILRIWVRTRIVTKSPASVITRLKQATALYEYLKNKNVSLDKIEATLIPLFDEKLEVNI